MATILCFMKILIMTSCTSCVQFNGRTFQNLNFSKQSIDTLTKEIPVDRNGQYMRFYKLKKIVEDKSNFQTIEQGFDSIEIRIWYGSAGSDKLQLLTLTARKSKWRGMLYQLDCHYDYNRDSIKSISTVKKIVYPKTGWSKFLIKLEELKIYSLPNYSLIKDYDVCNDGDGVTIEFATTVKYKIYNYPCFESNYKIWQARKISKMMKLIESEFSFKRLK